MTTQQRHDLLEHVTTMVIEDFGEAGENAPFNPFDPADVARQSVIMLQAVYNDFIHTDDLAESILSRYRGDNSDIENIAAPV